MINKFLCLLTAFTRLLLFVSSSLLAIVSAFSLKLITGSHPLVYRVVYKNWARFQRFHLNVKVDFQKPIPNEAAIIMANHRSYLDVVLVYPENPIVFVAKHEVSKWPLIGWGGKAVDTIWVKRDDPNSRKTTRLKIKERMKKNKSVMIFPEGTTSNGPGILPFKPGMFKTAAEGHFPIIPVALEYDNPKISWIGDDKFLPHFIRTFGKFEIKAKVRFGDALLGDNGEKLKHQCQDWIREQCAEMREEFSEEWLSKTAPILRAFS